MVDGWCLVVAASDGTNLNLYVNGELVGSGANPTGGMSGLWYYYNCKTDVTGYAMAYLTIYNVGVTAEQAAVMFDPSAAQPSESPSPSEDPTPSSNPTTVLPDDNGNPVTFDAGILALGAMALSSCLAMRKRGYNR